MAADDLLPCGYAPTPEQFEQLKDALPKPHADLDH